jgi:hypothetical protein
MLQAISELPNIHADFPQTVNAARQKQILSVIDDFTKIVEQLRLEESDLHMEEVIYFAILRFHHNNTEAVHKKLYPDFDEDARHLEENVALVFALLKKHWAHNEAFEKCLLQNTHKESGLGHKSLFISALDL